MSTYEDRWKHRLNGSVKIEPIPQSDWSETEAEIAHTIEAKYKIRWEPPYQVACQLPDGFALEFKCWMGTDGIRRFTLVKPLLAFIFEASLAGHALLVDRNEDQDKEKKSAMSYHAARLFNQFSRHPREYLGETLQIGNLLYVSKAGRLDPSSQDILPEDIGVNAAGKGRRWDMVQFKDIGIEAAQAAGVANPTVDEITWFALHEAAKRNPLRTSDVGTEDLIKLAFYTFGPEGTQLDEAAIVYVAEQVQASLKGHLNDSTEEFEQWIKDPKSNLITRIAKRKDCRWTKEEIRRALLELGWRSFKMLAQCIDICMRAFAAALPEPLTKEEAELFARMYLAHRYLGRIPMVLLQERFTVLKQALLEIWREPDNRRAVAVLRRLVWYYSEIVANRRAGDNQYKHRSFQRNDDDRTSRMLSIDREEENDQSAMDIGGEEDPDPTEKSAESTAYEKFAMGMRRTRVSSVPQLFKETAIRMARARGYSCKCKCSGIEWEAYRVDNDSPEIVMIDITCHGCNFAETLNISQEDSRICAGQNRTSLPTRGLAWHLMHRAIGFACVCSLHKSGVVERAFDCHVIDTEVRGNHLERPLRMGRLGSQTGWQPSNMHRRFKQVERD